MLYALNAIDNKQEAWLGWARLAERVGVAALVSSARRDLKRGFDSKLVSQSPLIEHIRKRVSFEYLFTLDGDVSLARADLGRIFNTLGRHPRPLIAQPTIRVQERFTEVNGSSYPWGSQFYKALNHDQCCAQDEAANTAAGIVPQHMSVSADDSAAGAAMAEATQAAVAAQAAARATMHAAAAAAAAADAEPQLARDSAYNTAAAIIARLTRESERASCKNPLHSECGKDHHMDDGHGHAHTLDDGHAHTLVAQPHASTTGTPSGRAAAAVDPDEISGQLADEAAVNQAAAAFADEAAAIEASNRAAEEAAIAASDAANAAVGSGVPPSGEQQQQEQKATADAIDEASAIEASNAAIEASNRAAEEAAIAANDAANAAVGSDVPRSQWQQQQGQQGQQGQGQQAQQQQQQEQQQQQQEQQQEQEEEEPLKCPKPDALDAPMVESQAAILSKEFLDWYHEDLKQMARVQHHYQCDWGHDEMWCSGAARLSGQLPSPRPACAIIRHSVDHHDTHSIAKSELGVGVSGNSIFADCQQLAEALSLDKETTAAAAQGGAAVDTGAVWSPFPLSAEAEAEAKEKKAAAAKAAAEGVGELTGLSAAMLADHTSVLCVNEWAGSI